MKQRRHSARFLVAVFTTLLSGSLAAVPGLVLCLGSDGHRAIEFEHGRRECLTLATSQGATATSVQPGSECVDLPAAGTGSMARSSSDRDPVPMPPVAFLVVSPEPTPPVAPQLPASTDARAGLLGLALHLRSTVLLV